MKITKVEIFPARDPERLKASAAVVFDDCFTIGITLQNPGAYAKNVCDELNKLAKKMSGMQIPGKTVKTFISSVEGLSMIRSNLTVWDVIEILWDLPESTGTGENYKDSLMKTVSRVINLDHTGLDVA